MTVLDWALGFGIGAAVVALNFWALGRMVRMVLLPGARAPRVLAALGLFARLLGAGLILGLALRYLPVSPLALILGVSVVPAALLARAFMAAGYMTTKVR